MRAIFDRYASRLIGIAQRKGLNSAEAQDAAQQTFVHFHQGRQDFKKGARVRPWLYTNAFNVMRDLGRRFHSQRQLKEAIGQENQTDIDDEKPAEISRETAALSKLSREQREVIILHYDEEISFAEIARIQGCKQGAIRARAHREYGFDFEETNNFCQCVGCWCNQAWRLFWGSGVSG